MWVRVTSPLRSCGAAFPSGALDTGAAAASPQRVLLTGSARQRGREGARGAARGAPGAHALHSASTPVLAAVALLRPLLCAAGRDMVRPRQGVLGEQVSLRRSASFRAGCAARPAGCAGVGRGLVSEPWSPLHVVLVDERAPFLLVPLSWFLASACLHVSWMQGLPWIRVEASPRLTLALGHVGHVGHVTFAEQILGRAAGPWSRGQRPCVLPRGPHHIPLCFSVPLSYSSRLPVWLVWKRCLYSVEQCCILNLVDFARLLWKEVVRVLIDTL